MSEAPSKENHEVTENKNENKKPRLLLIAFGGCNGCHITVLDLHEEVTGVLSNFEIVRGSVIADMNRDEIPESDIAIIEGAVCNSENEEELKKVREKTKTLIALGSCACYGGIPGLRNYFDVDDVIKEAYVNAPSNDNPEGNVPDDYSQIPKMKEVVEPVGNIVNVDYMVPGCPPVPSIIKSFLETLLNGETPMLPTKNLCDECGKKHKSINPGDRGFFTMHISPIIESDLNPEYCFLEQGVLCMGPATRSGCGGRCTEAGMPCRGCMGPNPKAIEQGSEICNAMAPMLPIGQLIQKEDLPGTFYRFALASSILPTHIKKHKALLKKKGAKDE